MTMDTRLLRPQFHWFSPVCMLIALFAGLLFALGHHVFYDKLDGSEIPTGNYTMSFYDSGISKQQSNIAIGTALAFAVKTSFVLAVSTAYFQLFWRSLVGPSSRQPSPLHAIDKAHSALRDATVIINFRSWKRFPLLLTLGLITWLIPIASIVTPATLSVESRPMNPPPNHLRYAPTISFDSLSYVSGLASPLKNRWSPSSYVYRGPNQSLKRIAAAVSALGTVLPIDPPLANASWSIQFDGPANGCDSLSKSEELAVLQNFRDYVNSGFVCIAPPGYITWYGDLPYTRPSSTSGNETIDDEEMEEIDASLRVSGLRFRVAVVPGMFHLVQMSTGVTSSICASNFGADDNDPLSFARNNSTVLQCELVQSTYLTEFKYVNGNQTIKVEVPKTSQDKPVPATDTFTGPTNTSCVGFYSQYPVHPDVPGKGPDENVDWPERCEYDSQMPRRLAYQAILDAFYQVISGPVAEDQSSAGNVISTTLLKSRELNFLTNYARIIEGNASVHWSTVQAALLDVGRADVVGLSAPESEDELPFQNITVSLMSSRDFQPRVADNESLPQTMITSETYHNVYVYASRRLWIAYSIAATSAIAAVIIGMYTIVVTGASYSDDFSTILRVSRHAHLDNEVAVADGNGRDPLPEYLANTTITVARDAEIGEEGPAFTERDTTTTTSSQRLLSGEDQPSSA